MLETRIVQKFGNSAHIVLPKEYIGKRIKFITKTKTFNQIKSEIIDILTPYLENILGVYLYGSYARNEENLDSDIDILVITDTKIKIKEENYEIISTTLNQIGNALKTDPILILPILKEAKPIINPELIRKYRDYNFTRENTKGFIESCERIIKINKESLDLDLGIGSIVYSLILRIRGLLMIDIYIKNKSYSSLELFSYLEKDFTKDKAKEFYSIYSKVKNNYRIEKSNIITKEDLQKLIDLTQNLLKKIKEKKWEKRNIKKV